MDMHSTLSHLDELDPSIDPLANSSFHSHSHSPSESPSQKPVSDPPQNQLLKTPPLAASEPNVPLIGNAPKLLDQHDSTNVSVFGLDPVPSPRKLAEKLLFQPTDSSPRLVIDKLVLTNFKSYAGIQEIGPFHTSFSAVVGPNGSGKSNVIDSLLFVFGFRANKMRQSKLCELIHNSESFPNLDFCQVDIHFAKVVDNYDSNGNPLSPTYIPNSNLLVSRRAEKNNASTYFINNKKSNYTEVTTLLKKEGIDLDHKRFLILQGEVEMIAQMKPKAETENDDGLLEYLEDIIGTSNYKQEIEEITRETETLQEKLTEKERIFKITEKQHNDLISRKEQAIEYLILEKKLKQETARYWYLTHYSETLQLEKYSSKLQELNHRIKGDNSFIEEAKRKIENLKKKKSKLSESLNSKTDEITTLRKKFKSVEREQVSARESLRITTKKSENLEKTLENNKKSLNTNENELKDLNSKIKDLEESISEVNRNLVTEVSKLDELKAKLSSHTKTYSDQIDKLQQKLEPWKTKLDKNKSEYNIKKAETELLENQLEQILNESNNLKAIIVNKEDQLKLNSSKIEALVDKKSVTQENIQRHTPNFEVAGKELKRLEFEIKELGDKIEDTRNKASSSESQNKVLNALNKLQQSGRITGFYGRLGDLGSIDDKYDIAVSTGGGSLNDFVVETVEDAQTCIQYLRQNRLGFGKFIVLQKLRKFNLNKINTPENTPRLFDLIKPIDAKFAPAFYSSMYDTLVAPNLTVANRVAFGGSRRWRVVTLDGKLVDVSGTMSGGGNRVNRGGMKLSSNASQFVNLVSAQQLKEWKDELEDKEKRYNVAEDQYRKMDQLLRKSQEDIPRMSAEIQTLKMENTTLKDEIEDTKARMNDWTSKSSQITLLQEKIEKNSKSMQKINKDRAKLEETSTLLQSQIDELQQKIIDTGGIRLKTQTNKVQSLKDEIQLKSEIKQNDELRVTKLQNQNQKLVKLIEQSGLQLEEISQTITQLTHELETKTKEAKTLGTDIEKLDGEKDRISFEINETNDQLEVEDSTLREKSDLIASKIKEIEKIETVIRKIQIEIDHARESFNNIEYRDVHPLISWMAEDDPLFSQLIQEKPSFDEEYAGREIKSKGCNLKKLGEDVDNLKKELSDLTVNLDILPSFGSKEQEFQTFKSELEEAATKLHEIKERGEELNERRHSEFSEGFNQISSTLKSMYHLITAGGMAELEYSDSHDAFSEGIVFSVMPPKKSWRTISNLSGGEKTLASLALVFALHHYKPTPLYVMDEIDAALDFKNVSIVANYIKSRTKNAQFIVISLRNNMFELAESLIGIYKVNNMTKSATLINRDLIGK